MTDLFNDISIIPAEYTIYVTLLFGLIVKYLWILNIEYHFTESTKDPYNITHSVNYSLQKMRYYVLVNPILTWIVKCIRRKVSSGDDAEGFFPINYLY